MTPFFAIAARELRDRSRLFVLCAALAVLPFVAGLLPAAKSDRAGVIATTSSYLALTLALGSALVLGASTVMRDMVERRLSFYFSKPLHAGAIWFGKAAACLIASFLCFAIIALPTALFVDDWPGPGMWMLGAPELIGLTVLGVVVLFFVSHLFASVIRSRSVLVGLDFALAAIAATMLVLLVRPLLLGGALDLARMLGAGAGVALLLIAVLAPRWQLANGRTDIKRAHASLSKVLWPAVYVVVLLAAAYVLWVVTPDLDELRTVQYLQQAPAGETVVAGGRFRGRGDYYGYFILHGNGEWQRVPAGAWSEVLFSRDGKTRSWIEPVGFMPRAEFEIHTNRGPSGIRVRSFDGRTLSDDGSRIAIATGNLVTVYDTASGRLLASAGGFDGRFRHVMFFVSNDLLRILELSYGTRPARIRAFELDIRRRKLTKTGETVIPRNGLIAATPDGSRLLLRKIRRLVDGRTLATIAELPPAEPVSSTILSDGRVAETVREGNQSRLRVYGAYEVVLPAPHTAVVGELRDGTLMLRGTEKIGWSATGAGRTMFLVRDGRIVQSVPQFKGPGGGWTDPRLPRYDVERIAGVDAEGKIVWWDLKTGRTERAPRE